MDVRSLSGEGGNLLVLELHLLLLAVHLDDQRDQEDEERRAGNPRRLAGRSVSGMPNSKVRGPHAGIGSADLQHASELGALYRQYLVSFQAT